MHARQNALKQWLETQFSNKKWSLTPLAGDASFRHYYRLQCQSQSFIIMDAPPEQESLTNYIYIHNNFKAIGIRTPEVYHYDITLGAAILEDIGDTLLLHRLSTATATSLYLEAFKPLFLLQAYPERLQNIPTFDQTAMLEELQLFRQWFLHTYLDLELSSAQSQYIDELFMWLTEIIANEPQVLIHRDYHSRNLMLSSVPDNDELVVIDFQDAMYGPCTYDLVSLLKDCYIQWPRAQILQWLEQFYRQLCPAYPGTLQQFIYAFDMCGLQRHLKVLGIFCRLAFRDSKTAYLGDLPRTFEYVLDCLNRYPQLKIFASFMQQQVFQAFKTRQAC